MKLFIYGNCHACKNHCRMDAEVFDKMKELLCKNAEIRKIEFYQR